MAFENPGVFLARLANSKVFAKYVLVGGSSAALEFFAFSLLHGLFGLPLLVANLSSIALVIVFGFLSHKHFTFLNTDRYGRQIRWYIFMLIVSITLNNALLWTFVTIAGWPASISKILQIGLCFMWNYSFSSLVVFPREAHSALDSSPRG